MNMLKLNNDWMALYIHAGKKCFRVRIIAHSLTSANRYLELTNKPLAITATDDDNLVYITDVNPS